MLVKKLMKIFQKFFKEDQKLNANEIVIEVEDNKYKKLDDYLNKINTLITPAILYENSPGTSNNFILSDSVENYRFIEVYAKQENYTNGRKYEKLEDPNGKKVMFNYERYETNPERLQSFGLSVTFNGTAATVGDKFGFVVGGQTYSTTGDSIKIVKVLGYK